MDDHSTISGPLCVAARALLRWDQVTLAERAGVSRRAVQDLEGEARTAHGRTVTAVVAAFEAAGIRFLHPGPGIQLITSDQRLLINHKQEVMMYFIPLPFPGTRLSYPAGEEGFKRFIADFAKHQRDQFELYCKMRRAQFDAAENIERTNFDASLNAMLENARSMETMQWV